MTRYSSPSPEDRFNDYLDVLASGRSTPDASDFSNGSHAEAPMPVDVAREVHELAHAVDSPHGDQLDGIWEAILGAGVASTSVTGSAGIIAHPLPPSSSTVTTTRSRIATRFGHRRTGRLPWVALSNVALILVLIAVGFGGYRLLWGTGDDAGTPLASGVAIQASPTVAPIAATPPSSSVALGPVATCNIDQDMPIFRGESSEWSGTSLVLAWDGTLSLHCREEPSPVVLADDVENVSPLTWPGTVRLDLASGRVSILSLQSGASLDLGPIELFELRESVNLNETGGRLNLFNQVPGSPWLVTPAAVDLTDWRITDLRSMESRLLSDYIGEPMHHSRTVMLSGNRFDSTAVISVLPAYDEEMRPIEDPQLPGDSLVLHRTLDEASWIAGDPKAGPVFEVQVSPDGRFLATMQVTQEGETTITISQATDGEILTSTMPYMNSGPRQMLWVNGDAAVVYVDQGTLRLLEARERAETEALFAIGDDNLPVRLRLTPDDSIVLMWGGSGDVTAVNVATGDTTLLPGFDRGPDSEMYRNMAPVRFLVTSLTTSESSNESSLRIVDTVTGTMVFEVPDVRVSNYSPQTYRIDASASGETAVIWIDDDHTYLARVNDDDTTEVVPVEVPQELREAEGLTLPSISPSGMLVALTSAETNTGFVVDLDSPETERSAVLQTYYPLFVAGTGG